MAGPKITTTDISDLLRRAAEAYRNLSPEEKVKHDEAQRQSWLRGMAPCEHGVSDWETCPQCRAQATWKQVEAAEAEAQTLRAELDARLEQIGRAIINLPPGLRQDDWPASIKTLRAERDEAVEMVQAVVSAWESLPGPHHYGIQQVQTWLNESVAPVVNTCRAFLAKLKGGRDNSTPTCVTCGKPATGTCEGGPSNG